MGAKESKIGRGESTEAFHESTLKDSILTDIQKRLQENFNIQLKPATEGVTGPVLVIKDGTNDDVAKLIASSKSLGTTRLLVVLVPKVKDQTAGTTERLVFLKNSLDFSKQEAAVNRIVSFIRSFGGNAGATSQETSLGSIAACNSPELGSATAADELSACSARKLSTPADAGCKQVYVAFAQDEPEKLLRDAVGFLEDHIDDVKFQPTENMFDSPLLVILKNDGRLKTDVADAVGRTRSGSDVMLLVVTCEKHIKLDGIEAAENMGAKEQLYWDTCTTKYSKKKNKEAIRWVLAFLKRFGPDFAMKRKDNIRQSLKSLGRTPVSGWYFALASIREEVEKNVVFFMEEYNMDLTKTNQPCSTKPLVLLTASDSVKEADEFLESHIDPQSVLIVIAQKPGLQKAKPCEPMSNSLTTTVTLCLTDLAAAVITDLADNKKARGKVKTFLIQKTYAKASEEKQDAFLERGASSLDVSCEQSSLGSSSVSTNCFLDEDG